MKLLFVMAALCIPAASFAATKADCTQAIKIAAQPAAAAADGEDGDDNCPAADTTDKAAFSLVKTTTAGEWEVTVNCGDKRVKVLVSTQTKGECCTATAKK